MQTEKWLPVEWWVGFLAVQFLYTTSDLAKWAEQDSGGEPLFVWIFLLARWLSGDLKNQIICSSLAVSQSVSEGWTGPCGEQDNNKPSLVSTKSWISYIRSSQGLL